MKKLWGGRFGEDPDRRMMDYTSSLRFDIRLLPYDIAGSIAHAGMLGKAGLLTPSETREIIGGLEEVLRESGEGQLPPSDAEDVHSYVENLLREKIGDPADKLHTGRSRNDQVALDIRLYLLDVSGQVLKSLRRFQETLVARAEENLEAVMPGYTHLQPAQPVLLSHHLMAYFEKFRRDGGRFEDARRRASECPLGSGALAGTSLPLDREWVARELGFDSPTANSLDSVSERDFPLEFSSASAVTMVHVSRLAEELVLWSSPAYGFVRLPDRLATGSSMMPQKKNPDVAELSRARSGRVFGNLMALLTVMKGLPLAYHRDMQEDKEALFDTVDTLLTTLDSLRMILTGIEFDTRRMALEAGRGHTVATDLAEYLVRKGMPFRQGHEVVGAVVKEAEGRGLNLDQLTTADLAAHSDLFTDDVAGILTPEGSVGNKVSFGSTSPTLVAEAVKRARVFLGSEGNVK